ncbi:MAG TPA: gamma-glutamyl-gamma-aminobutyrate hydrolase family protein [Anaerolineae bacterium]|nr:gamma-glutamyl-gamma-aminobutyrate hydrolase family protein [Anaerolineae bacterium]
MSHRPLIGITAFETRHINLPHLPIFALNRRYVMAVEAAGGAPVMLPPGLSEDSLRSMFERLNGLLLSGGGDIDPACYGEAPHPASTEINADRDRMELALARQAVDGDKALLSICRGIQVFNVALGGTLVQDIPAQIPGALQHNFDSASVARTHIAHPVQIDAGTRLSEVMGVDQAGVNSWHHQSLKQIAPGLKVTALSPDGVIEAVELPGHRFALGVQWHPEWLYDRQPEMKRLFEALVQAASE